MRYTKSNQLTEEKLLAVENLIASTHQYDKTARWLFLSNCYNIDLEMPCFFIAEKNNQVIGFGLLVIETDFEAEMSIIVHPEFRRQGIARRLHAEMTQVSERYSIKSIIYKTERIFREAHPQWAASYYLAGDSVSEYLMEYRQCNGEYKESDAVQIQRASSENSERLAHELAISFDSSYEEELRFIQEMLVDSNITRYLFLNKQGEIVGTCAIDWSRRVNYVFALIVFKKYQNRGYAKSALIKLMEEVRRQSDLPIQLQVESDNVIAKRVYQAVGFEIISEVESLIRKNNG